jgi:hypothetical protein
MWPFYSKPKQSAQPRTPDVVCVVFVDTRAFDPDMWNAGALVSVFKASAARYDGVVVPYNGIRGGITQSADRVYGEFGFTSNESGMAFQQDLEESASNGTLPELRFTFAGGALLWSRRRALDSAHTKRLGPGPCPNPWSRF